jgi:hypothetical protein
MTETKVELTFFILTVENDSAAGATTSNRNDFTPKLKSSSYWNAPELPDQLVLANF